MRKILGAILRVMSENPATDIWKSTSNNKKRCEISRAVLGLSDCLGFS